MILKNTNTSNKNTKPQKYVCKYLICIDSSLNNFSRKIVAFIFIFVNNFIIYCKVKEIIIIYVYIFFNDIIITFFVIKFL